MSVEAILDAEWRFFPYKHQLKEFEISADSQARALMWQMRTGKSKFTIDKACHLFKRGLIDTVCIFAPNGVHENWLHKELPKHHWLSVPYEALEWDSETVNASARQRSTQKERDAESAWRARFEELLKVRDKLVWFAFNSESVASVTAKKTTARLYGKRKAIFSVWDESTDFRTPGTKRTKNARAIATKSAYRMILEGTLTENSPLHTFAQFELLDKGALGFTRFDYFKDFFCVQEKQRFGNRVFKKVVGYQNLDVLKERMSKYSSVVLRSDCEDLPDLEMREVVIDMTEQQRAIYEQVLVAREIDIKDESSINIGKTKIVKLQQVLSGFLKDRNGRISRFDTNRFDVLMREIRMSQEPVVILAYLHEEIDEIVRRLTVDKLSFVQYHGRVSDTERRYARTALDSSIEHKSGDRPRALVGQWAACARGVEFSAAGKIICFSHTFNAIHRQQGIERATAMHGQNVEVVDFIGGPVDRYVRDNVDDKISIADDLARRGLQAVINDITL